MVWRFEQPVQRSYLHALHARYRLPRRDDSAYIDILPECEVIGVKESQLAARQFARAEDIEQRSLDVGPLVIRQGADLELEVERNIARRQDGQVVAKPPVGLKRNRDVVKQRRARRFAGNRIHGYIGLVPASRPFQFRRGAL